MFDSEGGRFYTLLLSGTVVVLFIFILLIWLYNYFTCGQCKDGTNMKGKTVIITGANSGVGRETAKDLAKRGAKVIMACRNMDLANKVKEQIIVETNNSNVIVKKLDLSSLQSVRDFCADINRTEKKLDVLINNAGMADTFKKMTTEDGLEMTMATNQYGPFLLTNLLLDLLKKSAPSRIVIVASELYRFATVNLENPNPTNQVPVYLYYVSKYANIMFSLELARRLEGSNVTVNCLHPGMIDSGIWRNVPFPLNLPMKAMVKMFFKTPEQGAQTSIYLAVSKEVEGVTGKYFSDCKESSLASGPKDATKNKKYWEICERLVKL